MSIPQDDRANRYRFIETSTSAGTTTARMEDGVAVYEKVKAQHKHTMQAYLLRSSNTAESAQPSIDNLKQAVNAIDEALKVMGVALGLVNPSVQIAPTVPAAEKDQIDESNQSTPFSHN